MNLVHHLLSNTQLGCVAAPPAMVNRSMVVQKHSKVYETDNTNNNYQLYYGHNIKKMASQLKFL